MIVVFGSTGTIGGQALAHLREHLAAVRAAVRSPAGAEQLSAVTVVADLSDPATLPAALEGADHVFVATPGARGQVELETALVDAITGTGTHLVKLAGLGYNAVPADQAITLAANHARIVQHARGAGVPLTVTATAASPRTC